MSDLISKGELFNKLAPVQTLGEAYGIIQGMDTVDAIPINWIMTQVEERVERGTAFDISVASILRTMVKEWRDDAGYEVVRVNDIEALPPAQPGEDVRAMCGECDAWNKYKSYPQPEQFNPCTVCQEFDCTGCKFRRV